METSKLLTISWKAYAVFLIIGIVLTLMNLVSPFAFYLDQPFEQITGESWTSFADENPQKAFAVEMIFRSGCITTFTTLLMALFITMTAYKKGEKWAWIALIVGLVVYSGLYIITDCIAWGVIGVVHDLFWLCVGLIILLLPVKEMWDQKTA